MVEKNKPELKIILETRCPKCNRGYRHVLLKKYFKKNVNKGLFEPLILRKKKRRAK